MTPAPIATIHVSGDHSVEVRTVDRNVTLAQGACVISMPAQHVPQLIIALNTAMHTIGLGRIG